MYNVFQCTDLANLLLAVRPGHSVPWPLLALFGHISHCFTPPILFGLGPQFMSKILQNPVKQFCTTNIVQNLQLCSETRICYT
jgi:hypothetical protein